MSSPGVKALEWTALGELPTERGINRLMLQTRVEPFVRAQIRSWFEDEGETTARTLIVEPDGAWMEYKGERKALPDRQAAHERAQYGLYGYLLELERIRYTGMMSTGIEHPGLPPIWFRHAADGRPTGASYAVPDHASDGKLDQRIDFEGMVTDQGLTWPKRITMRLAKAAPNQFNFRITIDDFTVIPA